MKHQPLFSSKDKSTKIKCRLLQILYGPLGVKEKHLMACENYKISNQAGNMHRLVSIFVFSHKQSTTDIENLN